MSRSVLMLVSGGVDSCVGMHLLKEKGFRVEALFLKMTGLLEEQRALESAKKLAQRLGVRLHLLDVSNDFRREVIGYFEQSYLAGKTPNCCCICNYQIKMRYGFKVAERLGLESVATGHYARILRAKVPLLLRARDESKDQSYFLHRIPRQMLERLIFPLGELTKKEVRRLAGDLGLLSDIHPESQDICFFKGDYRNFLKKAHPSFLIPGAILTVDGKRIGTHKGISNYTVGQRRGLGIPDETPFYVVEIRAKENVIVVGKEEDLFKREMMVEDINWIVEPSRLYSLRCHVKIRSRHRAAPALIELLDKSGERVKVSFDEKQRAITPGQFAVFYKGRAVIGGGRICG